MRRHSAVQHPGGHHWHAFGGISIAIAEVVFLIIDILIWIPFIKAMDAPRLKAEQEAQVA